jgi:hypothetical protein
MRIDLHNFFQYYDPKNPKHVAAVEQLEVDLASKCPDLIEDTANWVKIFRTKIEAVVPGILNVPYYPQTDNYRDANRTCNSSSCAMCLEYFKPGTLKGAKGDEFLILMELSHALVTIFLLLILIVSLPLGNLLLSGSFIAALYLLLLVGTWL